MSGDVETPTISKDTIINPLRGEEEQKLEKNTINEDLENRKEKNDIS